MSEGKSVASRVENWVWVLVYGGLFVICIGAALARAGRSYAWGVMIAGGAVCLAGVVLVWVRSRMADDRGT